LIASHTVWSRTYLFFFSSRRRHTRSKRDWSSDVCSSDLLVLLRFAWGATKLLAQPAPYGFVGGAVLRCWPVAGGLSQEQERREVPARYGVWLRPLECIILSVKELYMDAQEDMHMNDYNKITALYSRLSVGDEDRDGGESNSIQNQKIFLENYARGQRLTNIRHYIDDD